MEQFFFNPIIFQLFLIGVLCFVAYSIYTGSSVRRSRDVIEDLRQVHEAPGSKRLGSVGSTRVGPSALTAMGLFSKSAQKRYQVRRKLTPLLCAIVALAAYLVFGSGKPAVMVVTAVLGLAGGYLLQNSRGRSLGERYTRSLEFFLPIVMERLVMAVQAGLDIIPALKAIVELDQRAIDSYQSETPERKLKSSPAASLDPVSELLTMVITLTESGLSFEQALRDVAAMVNCSALRHAFIHLAVAQKEGGEIIMPLRELSDSTQLYFQESAEEDIAKLPIKATLPLVCTFAGLILCFITSPLIQILTLTARAMPK